MKETKRELLIFGYGLSSALLIFFLKSWHRHSAESLLTFLLVSVISLVIVTTFKPYALTFLYRYWAMAAKFLGGLILNVILAMFFYLIFGTIGILLRLMKKDFLDRTMDLGVKSYWHTRNLKAFDRDSYVKQF